MPITAAMPDEERRLMPEGQQKRIATPGQNQKHYLAGKEHEIPVVIPADIFNVAEPNRNAVVITTRDHNAKPSAPLYVAVTETGQSVYEGCFTVSRQSIRTC